MSAPKTIQVVTEDNDFYKAASAAHTIMMGNQEIKKIILDGNTVFDKYPPFDTTYSGEANIAIYGNYTFTIKFEDGQATSVSARHGHFVISRTEISGNNFIIYFTNSYIYSSTYPIYTLYGTYVPSTDSLANVGATGNSVSEAMLLNNGSITMTTSRPTPTISSKLTLKMDQTTTKYREMFKRRVRENNTWQIDVGGTGLSSDTTNYHSGSNAVKLSGNSNCPVSISLNQDFSSPKTVTYISFWVYNPSSSNIPLRIWFYQDTGMQSNIECSQKTATANGWTKCVTNWNTTALSIYNFQIADFNNTGVDLTFDDIELY